MKYLRLASVVSLIWILFVVAGALLASCCENTPASGQTSQPPLPRSPISEIAGIALFALSVPLLLLLSSLLFLAGKTEQTEILYALAHDRHASPGARREAAWTLAELGRTGEATEIFKSLTQDKNLEARDRLEAARALAEMGRADEAAEALLDLLDPKQPENVVREAARALIQLGGTPAERTIRTAVEHGDERTALQIARAFRETPERLRDISPESILALVTSFPAAGKKVVGAASRLDPPPDWLAVAAAMVT